MSWLQTHYATIRERWVWRRLSSHSDSGCSSTREKEGRRRKGRRERGRKRGRGDLREDWFHCHGAKAYSDGVWVQIQAPPPAGAARVPETLSVVIGD